MERYGNESALLQAFSLIPPQKKKKKKNKQQQMLVWDFKWVAKLI